jgi:hypothetical protein
VLSMFSALEDYAVWGDGDFFDEKGAGLVEGSLGRGVVGIAGIQKGLIWSWFARGSRRRRARAA